MTWSRNPRHKRLKATRINNRLGALEFLLAFLETSRFRVGAAKPLAPLRPASSITIRQISNATALICVNVIKKFVNAPRARREKEFF